MIDMALLNPNPDAYEIGDLYRLEDDNILFEITYHNQLEEKRVFHGRPNLVSCQYNVWYLRSIMPLVKFRDLIDNHDGFDESGRLLFNTGSDNPLDHIGFKEIQSWSQLTRLETVKLHVMLIEKSIATGYHHSYFWLDNTEPKLTPLGELVNSLEGTQKQELLEQINRANRANGGFF